MDIVISKRNAVLAALALVAAPIVAVVDATGVSFASVSTALLVGLAAAAAAAYFASAASLGEPRREPARRIDAPRAALGR